MPQFTITVNRPEVSVSTTQTGPSVTINETPVSITQNTSNIAVTSAPHSVTVNTAATTIQTTTLDEAFQGEWGGSVTYHRGDLVRYEQSVYVYIDTTPRTTNAPDVDTDYWVLLFSETGLTGEQVIGLNRAINLTTWDPATEYSIGDIVVLRGDYEDSMDPVSNTTYPKFTLYRLCHISGSINVNPSTHCTVPSLDESNNLIFDANSAWQNLSGVRSIDGFSGDISLQALLDHGSVSLNALSFEQGSNENHGSFVVHADDSYFYGNALYIGGSTSDQLVGFLLTNSGGSGYVVMDPADGKIKFTNDLTNVYPLPTSTDDLAEGSTNKYYNNTLVADYLANNIITANEFRAVTGGYMVITDQAENNYFYVDDNATQVGAGSHTWQFNNDGSTSFPTFSLPATDGSASQVLTTNGSGVVTFATPSTSNITEGTNLFYTTTRFDDRLATKTTDNVSEGTTNKYFTNTRFDDRLATKSTTNLAEGTNLYYTTARQNTDFDARLGTKSTTNLAEGTNLYYTSTRANSDFDTRLATKSTTNLSEGTNLYHTDSRVRSALSGSTGITYNNTTGAIAVDTSTIATQSYVGTAIANLVDSSPSTLDTLNELAAALGDDPNFATTTATAIGTKLATADFTSTADTWLGTKSTTNLAEGTNLYHTTARARGAVSGGTGVTYDSGTGVISIGQSVATSADVTFNTVNANITDSNYVVGQLIATRNTSYTPPASPLTTITGSNGIVISSSTGGANGYGANIAVRYHSGDTTAAGNNAAALITSVANGTSASPSGIVTNQVTGTWNSDGYTSGTSSNYAAQISGANAGAGTSALNPFQLQFYARQNFINTTDTPRAITGASGTGSVATLTFATQTVPPYSVGQTVTIAGMTPSGYNGTVVITVATSSSISYTNATTGFTSGGTIAITTPVTGASGTGSVATLTFTTQNTAPYAVGQTVTIAGMTPSGYNGSVVITAASTSSISYANATTGFTSGGTIGAANTVTAAGMGYRFRGYPNSTNLTTGNRINFYDHTASAATFKSDAYTFADSVITGSTLTQKNYMTLGATTGSVNQDTFTVKNTAATSTYASFASAVGTINQDTFTVKNSAATGTYASFASAVGTINQDTFTVKNTAATTTYATFASTGHTLSAAGLHTFTRTTTGTPGSPEGRPSLNIQLTRTDQATPNNNDSTSFRTRVAGSNGTFYTLSDVNSSYSTTGNVGWNLSLANGDQTTGSFSGLSVISAGITSTTIRAGTASATPGASTVSDILTIGSTSVTSTKPIGFPVYTATAANAITGSVGQQICISNSAQGANPNGMMAFWDTTNARWSYIHDNSAV
ncbi:hypothetical protein UFOVP646_10 [uncultured Caudovirales phage]|uniref:Uncharacterized protein n=1 Tax=uncultured Caudovirales phage TaxID=2100421 RepID=A0A6J5LQL4_9CAUD|nr:hypothetical protein UFOVP284_12 [uncultured Caudovirales phage]CAB4154507.1 hypothetical protein UFOVP646_10 [uncultured Caudovirales phage]